MISLSGHTPALVQPADKQPSSNPKYNPYNPINNLKCKWLASIQTDPCRGLVSLPMTGKSQVSVLYIFTSYKVDGGHMEDKVCRHRHQLLHQITQLEENKIFRITSL